MVNGVGGSIACQSKRSLKKPVNAIILIMIQSRPPIGHLLFTFSQVLKYKTDFRVIINLPQRFRATCRSM